MTDSNTLSRGHRAYVIAMCAIIGAAFAYAACDWGRWPRLVYLPLRGEVAMSPVADLSIIYLGNVAWGLGGRGVRRRPRRDRVPRAASHLARSRAPAARRVGAHRDRAGRRLLHVEPVAVVRTRL